MTAPVLLALAAGALLVFGFVRMRSDGAIAAPQSRPLSRGAGLFALLAVAALLVTLPISNWWLLLLNLVLIRPIARRVARAGIRALTRL